LVLSLGQPLLRDDRLSEIAWQLFEKTPPGWARVQAICDFVHHHIAFGYEHARATKTAWEAYNEGKGVCRDYAHLAMRSARAMLKKRSMAASVGRPIFPLPAQALDRINFESCPHWLLHHG
jgi:Transglutaminase-like superfamily